MRMKKAMSLDSSMAKKMTGTMIKKNKMVSMVMNNKIQMPLILTLKPATKSHKLKMDKWEWTANSVSMKKRNSKRRLFCTITYW